MQIDQLKRREFITLLGGTAAAWPLAARAQQGTKMPRIGVLTPGRSEGADASRVTLNSLLVGLRELGYTEGQNIAIEREFGGSNPDQLRELAVELVKRSSLRSSIACPHAEVAKKETADRYSTNIFACDPLNSRKWCQVASWGRRAYDLPRPSCHRVG
jgi:putative ABC transport system substrate-binding protein